MGDDITGQVFNKVQGSFVDGYGIRTTIFMKGCPLACKWCCNPEGQSFKPELRVIISHCNGCGRCLPKCPSSALSLGEGRVVVDRNRCDGCGACIDSCYAGALEIFGTTYTVQEMYRIIKKDESFYRSSGGGLTIGGGEATWQPEFVSALIERCKRDYIGTALDTCGYVTEPAGIRLLQSVDLLLFDIKGIDPEKHIETTGVSNDVIWENLRMLGDMRKPIIIRLPIIPGYTDSDDNLKATAERLSGIKTIERVDILPVHHFGRVKYEQIGKEYLLDPAARVSEDRQEQIRRLFEGYGFATQIGG